MKRFVLVLAALAALSVSASAASLTVKITGVSDKGGTLMVAVVDEKGFAPGGTPVVARKLAAVPGEMTVAFDNVPAGVFGVKVLQDLNSNGKMDYTMGVFPSEPYGFSNNPVVKMGPPSWADVKFEVKPGANTVTVHLN